MGIQGLITFVKEATETVQIEKLAGKKVAIDSYCWLHKGAFGCVEKLAIGEKTDQYVKYCMNLIKMLTYHKITPIMVFDGRHLPAKANEEKSRREDRKRNKETAAQLFKTGQSEKARRYMAASIDITHAMALELMKACRAINIDCIVAPYEADAQLAYLNINHYVDCVITEDSDLILFGCRKVLFKLHKTGTAVLYDSDKLPKVMKLSPDVYQFSLFQRMCILSGCDYLPSLPGIGLVKAKKFVIRTRDLDLSKALYDIGKYLNMPKLNVTEDYVNDFFKAEATFLYQYVYDPKKRTIVRLNELPNEFPKELLEYSGKFIEDTEAFQHALGNIDPFTKKVMDSWNPDREKLKRNSIWYRKGNENCEELPSDLKPAFEIQNKIPISKVNEVALDETEPDLQSEYGKKIEVEKKRKTDSTPINQQQKRIKLFPVKNADTSPSSEKCLKSPVKSQMLGVPTSPVLSVRKTRRKLKSKFLSRTNSELSTSSSSTTISSFFQRLENVSIIYKDCEEDKTESNLEDISTDNTYPSSSQNSEVENQYSKNLEESLEVVIKTSSGDKSDNETLSPDKISPLKRSVFPARGQGLSRNQSVNKHVNTGQKLLTQFGFVKKQQLRG